MYSLFKILLICLFYHSFHNIAADERKKTTMLYTVSEKNSTIIRKSNYKKINESEIFDTTNQDSKAIDGRSTIFIRNSKHKSPKMKTLCENISQKKQNNNMHMDFIKQLLHKPETTIVGIDPYGESDKLKEKLAIADADLEKLDLIPPLELLQLPYNAFKKHAKTLTVYKLKHENLPISLRESALDASKIDKIQDASFRGVLDEDKSQINLSSELIMALLQNPTENVNKIKKYNRTSPGMTAAPEISHRKDLHTDKFDYLIQNTDKFLIIPDDMDVMRFQDKKGQTQCRYYVCHLKNPTKGTKVNKVQVDCKCKFDNYNNIPKTRSGKKLMFKQKPTNRLDVNKFGLPTMFRDNAVVFSRDNRKVRV